MIFYSTVPRFHVLTTSFGLLLCVFVCIDARKVQIGKDQEKALFSQ